MAQIGCHQIKHTRIEVQQCGCAHFTKIAGRVEKKVPGQQTRGAFHIFGFSS
jgi:hypothetical protein